MNQANPQAKDAQTTVLTVFSGIFFEDYSI